MTKDSAEPSQPTAQSLAAGDPPGRRSRVRVWLAVGIIGGLLAVLASAGVAVLVAGRFFNRLDLAGQGGARVHDGCVALETRLNRLTPPGATRGPAARADAIRDENVAVRLFLVEIEQQRDDRQVGRGGGRGDWLDSWRALLEARTVYAEALVRQSQGDEPAFFVAPRTRRGGPALDRLGWIAPEACHGPIRRLAAPDL